MGRWSQFDDDAYRLPAGVHRTGYDADTQTYFYKDARTGETLVGAPGAEYGVLERAGGRAERRPLYDGQMKAERRASTAPANFADILAPSQIASPLSASPTSSVDEKSPPSASRILPKMQGVVHEAVKRSATAVRRSATTRRPDHHTRDGDRDREKEGLLRRHATDGSARSGYSYTAPSVRRNESAASDASRWSKLSALSPPQGAPPHYTSHADPHRSPSAASASVSSASMYSQRSPSRASSLSYMSGSSAVTARHHGAYGGGHGRAASDASGVATVGSEGWGHGHRRSASGEGRMPVLAEN